MLDADMNVGYWTLRCERALKWNQRLKILVAITASGTALASLSIWTRYPLAWQGVSVIAGLAAVFHSVYLPPERLTKLSGLVATWKEILIDYELLWHRDVSVVSPEVWEEFEVTKRREKSVLKDESDFPVDGKLRTKAFKQVLVKRGLHK
jgi:hypothetical protein